MGVCVRRIHALAVKDSAWSMHTINVPLRLIGTYSPAVSLGYFRFRSSRAFVGQPVCAKTKVWPAYRFEFIYSTGSNNQTSAHQMRMAMQSAETIWIDSFYWLFGVSSAFWLPYTTAGQLIKCACIENPWVATADIHFESDSVFISLRVFRLAAQGNE